MKHSAPRIILFFIALALSGCEKMEAGEYGIVFSALPTWMGGGVKERVIEPGEAQIVPPWSTVYKVSSTDRFLSWGTPGGNNAQQSPDYVETRAEDGNEVGLSMTIQYSVIKEKAPQIIQFIGTDSAAIERLVTAVAQADIRTHMNILRTGDFFDPEERQKAVDSVKTALQTRLEPEGIAVTRVIYNDHRFERQLDDGTVDDSYQKRINETQKINQQTEQEIKRVAAVVEQKNREQNEAQAKVNRLLQHVGGLNSQAQLRGDAYLASKKNEAQQVRALGLAEVEGLQKQVESLKGPGGRAILRLEIVKSLIRSDPQFVVMGAKGSENTMQVDRVDTNQLLRQLGVMSAMQENRADENRVQEKKAEGVASSPSLISGQTPVQAPEKK